MCIINLDIKYRPSCLDEVIGHEDLKRDLRAFLKTRDVPNMMFIGPPGVGKNCVAYAFATEYLGRRISLDTEDGDKDYKEFNASMDRGIDIVRDDIEDFARLPGSEGNKVIIFLDEADSMTYPAQLALKSVIEKREKNCIFIFSLNNEDGIKVRALKSRCYKYHFTPPKESEIVEWFLDKAEKEGVKFESGDLVDKIVEHYKGDLRAMLIDCLEALKGLPNKDCITKEDLFKIYKQDSKSFAQLVFESVDMKARFIELWKRNNFSVRRFLQELQELRGWKDSKIAARVDANLRAGGSEMLQMCYYFDVIESG